MEQHDILQDSVTELPDRLAALVKKVGVGLGLLGLAAAGVLGHIQGDHYTRLSFAYLMAWAFFLSISLGALFFVTLQRLTRAGWSVVLRRLAEGLAGVVALMAVLALPMIVPAVLGYHGLFPWVDEAHVAEDHLLHHKSPYLNVGFFAVRCAIYFGAWVLMARFLRRNSIEQDTSGDPALTLRAERRAAPFMFVFALTLTFASIDFVMSLEPHWFSTIFGVYFFAGCQVSFFATLILVGRWLNQRGILRNAITIEHYHDLGKLLFGFNFFWSYIAFSQFMLTWYADIPEETFWYLTRQKGDWITVALVLIFGHFVIPFLGLISRQVKRNLNLLAFWAIWLLAMHWIDLLYLVGPSIYHHLGQEVLAPGTLPVGPLDAACFVGIGGLFVAAFAALLQKNRLVPVRDPRLSESLHFENI